VIASKLIDAKKDEIIYSLPGSPPPKRKKVNFGMTRMWIMLLVDKMKLGFTANCPPKDKIMV
jgi:hypothetical protein